jgi:hypothetical protein
MNSCRLLRRIRRTASVIFVLAFSFARSSGAQTPAPALLFSHLPNDPATRLTSAVGAAIAIPLDASARVTLSATGELQPAFSPLQVEAYVAGTALSFPLRDSRAFIVYRTAASPLRLFSSATPASVSSDSTRPGTIAYTMSRAPVSELSVGIGRRIGSISFELSTGATHGVVRQDGTTPGRIVTDSIWTDTLGWVPSSREIAGSRVTSAVGARWMSSELSASWNRSRFTAAGSVGARFAASRASRAGFGSLELSARVLPNVWLVGAAGVGPELARSIGERTRFSMLGLRFAYASRDVVASPVAKPVVDVGSTLTIAAIDSANYLFSLRLPDARQVELSGEFTHWQPVKLVRAPDGRWVVRLRVAPGAYRMNVRVDGGRWQAPPGTTPIADDFGGSAGVVVVPER